MPNCDSDDDSFFDFKPVAPAAVGSGLDELNRYLQQSVGDMQRLHAYSQQQLSDCVVKLLNPTDCCLHLLHVNDCYSVFTGQIFVCTYF